MAPITTAIFANSPLYKNKPTSYISFRGHIWTKTDPDRCGFPPGLRDDYSHEKVGRLFVGCSNDVYS